MSIHLYIHLIGSRSPSMEVTMLYRHVKAQLNHLRLQNVSIQQV